MRSPVPSLTFPNGFTAELLDDTAAARARIKDLIPEGAGVFTKASETLRLSGSSVSVARPRGGLCCGALVSFPPVRGGPPPWCSREGARE